MFKDLKFDMPSIVTLIILLMFTTVCTISMMKTGALDADYKQTLVAVVMLAVGFWLGSSSDSRKKTDVMIAGQTPTTPPTQP